jgi:FAD/FMN-containing dehydrogenase
MPLIKSPVELALMKEIKRAFDPYNILNPGKLLPDEQ